MCKKFIFFFLTALVLSSCLGEEEFSTSSTDRLSFGDVDTLAFDTLISGVGSYTQTFQVFNPNKKALRVSDIHLEKGSNSPFRVNVDGSFLHDGQGGGFEILANDSLRIFVEATAPYVDKDEPQNIIDKLVFVTEGGVKQDVVLTAYGQDVIPLKALIVNENTTFDKQRPYQIFDSLVVAKDATLTVEKGVRLYFHPEAKLIVHGKLVCNGELGQEVEMRGDRLGNMFDNQPYDRIPGQWGGVIFTDESFGNSLNFTNIHSADFGIHCDSSNIANIKLTLENSTVHNVTNSALYAKNCQIWVGNCQISNAGENCVEIYGGYSTFIHCTIAQFYTIIGSDYGEALVFQNFDGEARLPIEQIYFYNCLITGLKNDEIMGSANENFPDDAFNYYFENCLMRTPKYEDESGRLLGCVFDEENEDYQGEKNFWPLFDYDKLIFTFYLHPKSSAIDTGNRLTAQVYPLDRNGNSRFLDDGPDMGCFEQNNHEIPEE